MSKIQHATLNNIGGGIAAAQFRKGVEQVLDNIADNETSAVKQRTVTITWVIKPDQSRTQAEVEVSMKTGLAAIGSKKAITYLSNDENGNPRMTVSDPKQMELADQLSAVNEK